MQGGIADGILRLGNFSFLNFSGDFRFNTIDIPTNAHLMTRIRADRPPGDDIRVWQSSLSCAIIRFALRSNDGLA